MKMEAVSFCVKSVTNYQSTRGHVPEGCKLQSQASIKGREFLQKISGYQLFKKKSAILSYVASGHRLQSGTNELKKRLPHFGQRLALSPLLIDHYRILQQSQLGLRGGAT